ncbi:tetratricopeptide repeat protein [Luteimonas sp. A501]
MKVSQSQALTLRTALAVLAGLVFAIYWPGLQGDFLFDDFANLPALGRYGPVRDWDALLRYLTSGIADPTGRPVAMLSFLMDARNWPADPYPFKRSNVLLHVFNGLLLYSVLVALGRHLVMDSTTRQRAALVATAFWLLHPLWVSTVLYVVQRQAMLAAFFVLAGVRVWIASQDAFARQDTRRGYWLALLAVPVLGMLAGLSKMNGFLLPLLLWTLHVTILRSTNGGARKHAACARALFVHVPAAVLILTLVWMGVTKLDSRGGRPWSVGERLLSQPRAIFDYLERLFIPGLDATGVFADGFPLSTGWFEPATTMPALAGLVGLAGLAWLGRQRWPALSASALFFLAGHAMESSVVPLELYFEHRNYLPAAFLFWPLALFLTRRSRHHWARLTFTVGLAVLLATTTLAQTRLWGDPDKLAKVWARDLPQSPRAQTHAANRDLAAGRLSAVIDRLAPLAKRNPLEAQYSLTLLDAYCLSGQVPLTGLRNAEAAIAASGLRKDAVNQWISRLLSPDRNAPCAGLPDLTIQAFSAAAVAAASIQPSIEEQSRRHRIDALLALREGRCDAALEAFNSRLDIQRRPELAHEQIATLAKLCGPAHGLGHLDHYSALSGQGDALAASPMLRLRDRIIDRQAFWDDEWVRLRVLLEADTGSQPSRD